MLLLPLGETDKIGASCYYLNIEGTGILLDAGQSPSDDSVEGLPQFDLLDEDPDRVVDHVIITHAHHDHVGALATVVQRWPHAAIHMTVATRHLLDTLLPASARLQARRARENGTVGPPGLTEEEVEAVTYLFHGHTLEETFDLTGLLGRAHVYGKFFHAGHVLGAAGMLVTFEEAGLRRRLFYTSDTNLRNQTIHPGGEYPEPPIDVLVLESTLGADGDIENVTRRSEEEALCEAISRTLARGGRVLLPVFALGRAQEVLALIDRFKRRGRIPETVPVYTSGLMRGVSDIYDRTRYSSPRLDPEFEVYGVDQKRMPRSRAAAANVLQEPAIHIASSGMMLENTLSNRLAQRLMGDEKSGIFFVGFVKEDAPGSRLLEGFESGASVSLDPMHEPQKVRCEVAKFRLTGHSNRRDLISLVGRLNPEITVLVHGDPDARSWMADNIRFFHPETEVVLSEEGQPLIL
jgi:Cft2 family RNA processing exonuclease